MKVVVEDKDLDMKIVVVEVCLNIDEIENLLRKGMKMSNSALRIFGIESVFGSVCFGPVVICLAS